MISSVSGAARLSEAVMKTTRRRPLSDVQRGVLEALRWRQAQGYGDDAWVAASHVLGHGDNTRPLRLRRGHYQLGKRTRAAIITLAARGLVEHSITIGWRGPHARRVSDLPAHPPRSRRHWVRLPSVHGLLALPEHRVERLAVSAWS